MVISVRPYIYIYRHESLPSNFRLSSRPPRLASGVRHTRGQAVAVPVRARAQRVIRGHCIAGLKDADVLESGLVWFMKIRRSTISELSSPNQTKAASNKGIATSSKGITTIVARSY